MPPISGIDLSPMVAMIGLVLLEMLLLRLICRLTGSPFTHRHPCLSKPTKPFY
jgi:YggT family protein